MQYIIMCQYNTLRDTVSLIKVIYMYRQHTVKGPSVFSLRMNEYILYDNSDFTL